MRRLQFLITAVPFLALVLAANASAASLNLQWDPPTDTSTARYILHYGAVSGTYTKRLEVGAVASARVDGLADGTNYCFAVQALNSAGGASPMSTPVCGKTSGTYVAPAPTAPVVTPTTPVVTPTTPSKNMPAGSKASGVTAPPTGPPPVGSAPKGGSAQNAAFKLTAAVRDQRFIDITWRAMAGTSGYRVEVGTAAGATGMSTLTTDLSSTFAMADLPATTYYIRVKPLINGAYGAPTEDEIVNVGGRVEAVARDAGGSQCVSAPGAPVRFAAQADGGQVRLSWLQGAGDAPNSYVLQVGSAPGYQNLLTVALGAGSTGLAATAADGSYAIRLISVNACGASDWGSETILNVGTQAAELPGVSPRLTENVAGTRVSLGWDPPATGGAVTRYVLEVTTAGGVMAFDTGNSGTSFAHENTPSGRYVIRVRAGNSAGLGPASDPVTVVVP